MTAAYRLLERARLDARNTFGVHATAPMLVEVADAAALPELFGYAMLRDGPVLVLGGGSNLLFAGDPPGATLALTAQRIEMLEDPEDDEAAENDGPVQYEVTCPACNNTITIDEDVLALGKIQCPNCGEMLEFDAGEQFLLRSFRKLAEDSHGILAYQVVARMHQPVRQIARGREQQQAACVEVEPPHCDPASA